MTARLLIALHGVGASGASIAPLAHHLRLPAGVAVAAPDAPAPFDGAPGGPGRQWFSVAGVTAANRAARVSAAREGFDRVVGALVDSHGLRDRPEHVAFLGFSQGAIMALDAVASGRWPVGLVLAFSGRLATPPGAPLGTPILIAHGTEDGVIPATEAEAAHAALPGSDLVIEAGLGHAPGPRGVARAAEMVARWCGQAAQA